MSQKFDIHVIVFFSLFISCNFYISCDFDRNLASDMNKTYLIF